MTAHFIFLLFFFKHTKDGINNKGRQKQEQNKEQTEDQYACANQVYTSGGIGGRARAVVPTAQRYPHNSFPYFFFLKLHVAFRRTVCVVFAVFLAACQTFVQWLSPLPVLVS